MGGLTSEILFNTTIKARLFKLHVLLEVNESVRKLLNVPLFVSIHESTKTYFCQLKK